MRIGIQHFLREGLPFLRCRLNMRKNVRIRRRIDRSLAAIARQPEDAARRMQRLLRSITVEDLWRFYIADGSALHYHIPWRGLQMTKFPADLVIYEALIDATRPEVLIEIGTQRGGSALFFSAAMQRCGGQVVTIDVHPLDAATTAALTAAGVIVITGDATTPAVAAQVRALVRGRRCMVIDDGSHRSTDVLAAFERYHALVPVGGYYVIEDGMSWHICKTAPTTALTGVAHILERYPGWERDGAYTPFLVFTALLGIIRRTK